MDVNKYFGNRVKEERLKLKLSQEKLALEANIDRTYMNEVEKGSRNISLNIAYKLSKALKIPLSNLLKDFE